jgi:hypothetical protein
MNRAAALCCRVFCASGIAVAGQLVLPTPALAAGSEDNLAAGLQKFEDGRKAFEGGQFEEALAAFKASLALLPSPNTRLYMGRCYRALGKTASAFTALKLAAREAEDRLTASGEKRYGATRDTANLEAADLEAKVPRLTVAVPSNIPAGFVLKVDDKEVPQAAWGVATETDPGDVVVEATGPRLVPFKKTVSLKEGARETVNVPLARLPTATISVKLKTLPSGLALTLDGQPLPSTGIDTPKDLDVGHHVLVVKAPGYLPFKWDKSLADTEAAVVDVSLALAPTPVGAGGGTPKWMFFTVAGAAVAAAGAGAIVGVLGENQQSQQLALDKFTRASGVKDSLQTDAIVTDVLFGASGLLGAGAILLAFTTHWKDAEPAQPAVSIAPWFTVSGSAGVGAHGTF